MKEGMVLNVHSWAGKLCDTVEMSVLLAYIGYISITPGAIIGTGTFTFII